MAVRARASKLPRIDSPLTAKLAHSVVLSARELSVLAELQLSARTVPRNREIITEGRKYAELFVLQQGAGWCRFG
jgi:hypothetical protein